MSLTKKRSVGRALIALSSLALPGVLLSCDGLHFGGDPGVSSSAVVVSQNVIVSDTYVDEGTPTTNYSASTTLEVAEGMVTGKRFALIRWDTSTVPPGATAASISSAFLRFTTTGACSSGEYEARRIPFTFDPTTTNWECRNDTLAGPGCGTGATANWLSATQVVGTGHCVGTTLTIDVTSDFAAWLASPGSGGSPNGYLVQYTSDYFAFGAPPLLRSLEDPTVANRPTLTVTYDNSGALGAKELPTTFPPLDSNTPTNTYDDTRFIWDATAFGVPVGSNVQIGVAPNAISRDRAAHIRGHVFQFNTSTPAVDDTTNIDGVEISVLGRPELGRTFSRSDGLFDLVINGGGPVTLVYRKANFLESQRTVDLGWGATEAAPDVIMQANPSTCTGVLNSTTLGFVNPGTPWTIMDARGTREVQFYVPSGTTVTPPGGSPLTSWKLCFDEFTRAVEPSTGAAALAREAAMPADVATNTGYTYAFEGQVRDGGGTLRTGATFAAPIFMYVKSDSFSSAAPSDDSVDFPGGTPLPYGTYDRATGMWTPEEDGLVVQVVRSGTSCVVTPAAAVAGAELSMLCTTVAPANATTRYWRIPVRHFTPGDANVGQNVPEVTPTAVAQGMPETSNCRAGSMIHCEGRAVSELVPVIGLGQSLAYHSANQLGRTDAYSVRVTPTTGGAVTGLRRVWMRIEAAGQVQPWLERAITGTNNPPLPETLTWDGNDAFGRRVLGITSAVVRLRYEFTIPINCPGGGPVASTPRRFGSVTFTSSSGSSGGCRNIIATRERELPVQLGTIDSRIRGLGGLTLTEHHAYDPQERILYMGDGTRRSYEGTGASIRRVYTPPASHTVDAVAVAPAGDVYFAVRDNNVTTEATTEGIYRLGTAMPVIPASSIPILATRWTPAALAVGPTGRLYLGARHCVFEFVPNGAGGFGGPTRIGSACDNDAARTTGYGSDPVTAEGAQAAPTQVDFDELSDLFVHRDGSVYIADNRITGIGASGLPRSRIVRFVPSASAPGGGTVHFVSTGVIGSSIHLGAIAPSSEGDYLRTRAGLTGTVLPLQRVDSQGRATNIVGTPGATSRDIREGLTAQGFGQFEADNGNDSSTRGGLAEFGGDVYFSHTNAWVAATPAEGRHRDGRILRLDRSGRVFTFLGGPAVDMSGDDMVMQRGVDLSTIGATPMGARSVRNIATNRMDFDFRGDGTMFFTNTSHLFAIAPNNESGLSTAHTIASVDGSELYDFDAAGKHLRTRDAITGAVVWSYGYDARGRVNQIVDAENAPTTLTYNTPDPNTTTSVTIAAPGSLSTVVAMAAGGYVTSVTEPMTSRVWRLTLGATGLMTGFAQPDEALNAHQFGYESDGSGRLRTDTGVADVAGGTQPVATLSTPTSTATNPNYLPTRLSRTYGSDVRTEEFGMAVEEGSVLRRTSTRLTTASLPTSASTAYDSVATLRGSDTSYSFVDDHAGAVVNDGASYVRWAIDPRGEFDTTRYAAATRTCMPGHPTPADCAENTIASASGVFTLATARTAVSSTILIEQTTNPALANLFSRTRLQPDATFSGQRIDSVVSNQGFAPTTGADLGTSGMNYLQTRTFLDSLGRVRRVEAPYRHPICIEYTGTTQRPTRVYQGNFATCTYTTATLPQRTNSYAYNTSRWLTGATNGWTGGAGTTTTTVTPVPGRGLPRNVLLPGRTQTAGFQYGPITNTGDTVTAVDPPGPSNFYDFTSTLRDLPRTANAPATTFSAGPVVTGTTYDGEGRVESLTYVGGELVDPVYDANTGHLTAINLAEGNIGIARDGLGRATSISRTAPYAMTHGFDYGGTASAAFSPFETVTIASFSSTVQPEINRTTGRLDALQVTIGANPVVRQTNSYAPLTFGSLPFLTMSLSRGGIAATPSLALAIPAPPAAGASADLAHVERTITAGNAITTVEVNGFGELVRSTTMSGATMLYESRICTRDAVGRITKRIEVINLGGTLEYRRYAYAYNAQTRLQSSEVVSHGSTAISCATTAGGSGGTASYVYDVETGNRTSDGLGSVTYNAADQAVTRPNYACTWDTRGRLQTITKQFGQVFTFGWDTAGRMRTSSDTLFGVTNARSYEYDGRGRLVAIRNPADATQNEYFVYGNQTEPIARERNGIQQYYVYGSQPHVPDLIYENNDADTEIDAVYRVLTDERGSVRLVWNLTTNTLAASRDYNAWGAITASTGTFLQPFGYAGAIYLSHPNFWHMGARDYDPTLGRWTSRDPLGFGGGLNLYEYAGNDPVNYMDVDGREVVVTDPFDSTIPVVHYSEPLFARRALDRAARQIERPLGLSLAKRELQRAIDEGSGNPQYEAYDALQGRRNAGPGEGLFDRPHLQWDVPCGSDAEALRNAEHYFVAYSHGWAPPVELTIDLAWAIVKVINPAEWWDQTTLDDLAMSYRGSSDAWDDHHGSALRGWLY